MTIQRTKEIVSWALTQIQKGTYSVNTLLESVPTMGTILDESMNEHLHQIQFYLQNTNEALPHLANNRLIPDEVSDPADASFHQGQRVESSFL